MTTDNPPQIPTLTELALLPRWAKVAFMCRCATRVIPLIQSELRSLTDQGLAAIRLAVADADASARVGREVHVGIDRLPDLLEIMQASEKQQSMAGYALVVCASASSLPKLEDPGTATSHVGSALEHMVQAYAVIRLPEVAVALSVRPDYESLLSESRTGNWFDDSAVSIELGPLWPNGTPPGWPEGAV